MTEKMFTELTVAEFQQLFADAFDRTKLRSDQTYAEPFILPEVAARQLGVPIDLLRKWARAGEIPSYKMGNLWRFRASELREQHVRELAQSFCLRRPGVYALRAGEHFKIGKATRALGDRVRSLQTGQAHKLEFLGVVSRNPDDEKIVHQALAEFHVRGEWFAATPKALAVLAELMESGLPP